MTTSMNETNTLIYQLLGYPNINFSFLNSLTLDQLLIIRDIEVNSKDETDAQKKAHRLLENYPWPDGLSIEAMDYNLFKKHYAEGCSGDIAFYYYTFDKCIPRRGRNLNKFFMDRLATFAKASYRELWEEDQKWSINGIKVTLKPNKAASKKRALLPQTGEFAADHIIYFDQDVGCYEAEEKPCLDINKAIETYKEPKKRYNATYLMLYLEKPTAEYASGFYLHNYDTNQTFEMLPENPFPGYPEELRNVSN